MNNHFRRYLHLFLLTNLAIAQPILQKISDQPEFFVAHGATGTDLILTAFFFSFLVPFLLFFLEWTAGLFHRKASLVLHSIFITALILLCILPVLMRLSADAGYGTVVVSFLLACGLSLLYQRSTAAFQTLTLLSPLALAVPILFLLKAPVRSILSEKNEVVLHSQNAKTNVILMIFDEMPLTSLLDENGNIDDVRYPNFAALARGSNWYRNTTTCSSLTDIAVPTILTGNYPDQSRLAVLHEYPNNLFTLLGGSYKLHVKEAITMMDPQRFEDQSIWHRVGLIWKDMAAVYLHLVVPVTFADSLPSVTETWGNFWDEEQHVNRAADFREFVREIESTASPSLHFLHMMLPHKPWAYFPSGTEYRDYGSVAFGTLQNNRGVWLDHPEIVSSYQKRHLLQVGFLDRLVGELVDHLKKTGIYDSSLLILTSDHGAGFWPGESLRKPSPKTLQDILYVPLFVKLPGQTEGRLYDNLVETVDILPTIADVLNAEIPWEVAGQSILDPPEARRKFRMRMKPNNELMKFKSDFTVDSESFQQRLKNAGARTSFDDFFRLAAVKAAPENPELKKIKIVLLDRDAYENVDLQSKFVPAYICGLVKAPEDSKTFSLQILVNGVTRAVTRTFPIRRGLVRFCALVPETSFRQGKNKVDVVILE